MGTPATRVARLLEIMARLRDPVGGCPWDVRQTFETVAPHTLEEAYEVVDAIENGTPANLREELGDLLFQVVFHSRIAEEKNLFSFSDVVDTLADKLVRRHPHVFGDTAGAGAPSTPEEVADTWERIKARERETQPGGDSVLDGVTRALPALSRARALGRRVATVGFDWPTVERVLEKVDEERRELDDELRSGADPDRTAEELGDLFFALVQLGRKLGIDSEAALRAANTKFERRFRAVEEALARQGCAPGNATLEEMEEIWQAVKQKENRTPPAPGGLA
ncbi:nucleoside triphosphate pyrophosphohydrolase [Phaeovibrio sulfidiphilus]|uniref:Nucleoside triphosphate pyrophosphohydrolase n=1 Tax=Phaeovibrio sulfidiphilus TaxID=1220600 RepID=A0A8J6YWC2_9PROT|nr:nucleoside triphosphate pyrophosphohydrolase [Phaeovibrio sulfidiphilus]MBE1237649.1 nucleoside triphosphate pyrophosphohydrolase [Phaeovibrio sulfidiphilus]